MKKIHLKIREIKIKNKGNNAIKERKLEKIKIKHTN